MSQIRIWCVAEHTPDSMGRTTNMLNPRGMLSGEVARNYAETLNKSRQWEPEDGCPDHGWQHLLAEVVD